MAKLLIVDDEEKVRVYLTRLLGRRGHEVTAAADGQSALDLAAHRDFDVVLLDILMPGMSGMEVLPRLKALRPKMPVIMLTGDLSVKTGVESLKQGAFTYLTKPIDLQRLEESLEEALEHGRFI